jgi:AcrR family transcriptional regulator
MVAKVRPIGQERRGTERRAAILAAATELFAERGYGAVSIADVAAAAGTHKTTVLYHFPTKDALHDAVLDEAFDRIARAMREFLSGELRRDRLAYLLDQNHAFFAEHPALARLLQRELLDATDIDAYVRRFVEPIYLPAVRSLEDAMNAGVIRRIDPAFFIHDLHVQLVGYFCHGPLLERLRAGDPYTTDALIARRDYLVDQIFCQLLPPKPAARGGQR